LWTAIAALVLVFGVVIWRVVTFGADS